MANYKENHKQVEHHLPNSNFHVIHQYSSKTKNWNFMGFRCSRCNQSLKTPISLERHNINCKVINKTITRNFPPTEIITVNRTEWKPITL